MISDKLKRIVKIMLLLMEMVVILIAAIGTIAWLYFDSTDIIFKDIVILLLWIIVFKVHDLKK